LTLDPGKRARYTSEIIDIGESKPLFRVSMDDHPEVVFEGASPTGPWNLIASAVLAKKGGSDRPISLSGPEYYGLHCPAIVYLIQRMPGADKCVNYVMRQFVFSDEPEKPNRKSKKALADEQEYGAGRAEHATIHRKRTRLSEDRESDPEWSDDDWSYTHRRVTMDDLWDD
jgi:chromodomain-helicase-DNA-binding protein 7